MNKLLVVWIVDRMELGGALTESARGRLEVRVHAEEIGTAER
jgi:hypothetical protein